MIDTEPELASLSEGEDCHSSSSRGQGSHILEISGKTWKIGPKLFPVREISGKMTNISGNIWEFCDKIF